jgi:glucose-1-phosphate thymidylyltransferase
MSRCGIILAGGAGTRLHPLTLVTSKQLLPIYDKPMIYYPLSVLMLAGIRDILVITTPEDQAAFKRLLGDGARWGISLKYEAQPRPEGLAQAFIIGANFIGDRPSCLILGDNILYGQGLSATLHSVTNSTGATVFGCRVVDPRRYGVVEVDDEGNVLSIEEKPKQPKSRWAAIGLYFYDSDAPQLAREVKPSARGELEITDLNLIYLRSGRLKMRRLGRGYAWFDAGTHESLLQTAEFVRVLQERQDQLIAAPEEIAFRNGWIDANTLAMLARKMGDTQYSRQLLENLTEEHSH